MRLRTSSATPVIALAANELDALSQAIASKRRQLHALTDQIADHTATCEAYDIAETIRPWFPQAPAEVTEAIDALQAAVLSGTYTGGLEVFLGVEITR